MGHVVLLGERTPILLTDEIVLPAMLIRAGLEALPAIIRARGERASRRLIEILCRQNRPAPPNYTIGHARH
jgi:hypothetical protein